MSIGPAPTLTSRIHGCLLGGALGDSLGYAVEFDAIEEIRRRFGPAGLTGFEALPGGSHFSDDTQMTLYTVDGLVEALEWANSGVGADVNACLWLACGGLRPRARTPDRPPLRPRPVGLTATPFFTSGVIRGRPASPAWQQERWAHRSVPSTLSQKAAAQ